MQTVLSKHFVVPEVYTIASRGGGKRAGSPLGFPVKSCHRNYITGSLLHFVKTVPKITIIKSTVAHT